VALEPLAPPAALAIRKAGSTPPSPARLEQRIVDSADEGRLRVREHKRRGADLIKMMPSGGIASIATIPTAC